MTIPLDTRPNTYDEQIIAECRTHYYPDIIPYKELKRVADIGAHIGGFVAFVKEQSPNCTILAVEQDVQNYRLLWHNVAHLTRVSCYRARMQYVPKHERWLNLRDLDNLGACTLVPAKRAHSIRTMPERYELKPAIPDVITLETLCLRWDTADLLKVDCEGSEFDILTNASMDTLCKFRWIVGEYHRFAGDFKYLYDNRLKEAFELVQFQDVPDWGTFLLERK